MAAGERRNASHFAAAAVLLFILVLPSAAAAQLSADVRGDARVVMQGVLQSHDSQWRIEAPTMQAAHELAAVGLPFVLTWERAHIEVLEYNITYIGEVGMASDDRYHYESWPAGRISAIRDIQDDAELVASGRAGAEFMSLVDENDPRRGPRALPATPFDSVASDLTWFEHNAGVQGDARGQIRLVADRLVLTAQTADGARQLNLTWRAGAAAHIGTMEHRRHANVVFENASLTIGTNPGEVLTRGGDHVVTGSLAVHGGGAFSFAGIDGHFGESFNVIGDQIEVTAWPSGAQSLSGDADMVIADGVLIAPVAPGEAPANRLALTSATAVVLTLIGWVAHTRLRRRDVFAHPLRRSLHALIRSEPGLHASELARRLGVSRATIRYHAAVLTREGLVRTSGEVRPSYLATGETEAPAELRDNTRAALYAVLRGSGALTQQDLAARTARSRRLVGYHLRVLEDAGIVSRDDARPARYQCK